MAARDEGTRSVCPCVSAFMAAVRCVCFVNVIKPVYEHLWNVCVCVCVTEARRRQRGGGERIKDELESARRWMHTAERNEIICFESAECNRQKGDAYRRKRP